VTAGANGHINSIEAHFRRRTRQGSSLQELKVF
jgi:hypothetical protein